MATYRIRGTRRMLEQIQADVDGADLAAAAAAFVAGLESGAPSFSVQVTGSTVVAGSAKAVKRIRTEEDPLP